LNSSSNGWGVARVARRDRGPANAKQRHREPRPDTNAALCGCRRRASGVEVKAIAQSALGLEAREERSRQLEREALHRLHTVAAAPATAAAWS
jgi:hypothetical protein